MVQGILVFWSFDYVILRGTLHGKKTLKTGILGRSKNPGETRTSKKDDLIGGRLVPQKKRDLPHNSPVLRSAEILFTIGKILTCNMLKLAPQKVTLDRVKIKGRICKLSRGLDITIEPDDERLILSNEEFGLLISALTLEEGIAGISEELDTLFEVYVNENPENLTKDALILKKNLQSLLPAGAKA